MKKFLSIFVILVMILSLVACSSTAEPEKETEPAEIERDFPEGDYAEMGEGTVYIATAGGTSEDGNIPAIYVANDTIMTQIGLKAWDFNGGALSFIYIDGMLIGKEQLANSQTSLTLEGEQLALGIHTIEVVQYTNDEPGSEMIAYKSMQYEIKPK